MRESLPSILVSFAYRKTWAKATRVGWREVVLDSGAFTAAASGVTIDLVEFAEWAREQRATNPLVTEVFTLDVIGDWRASMRNTEELWCRGVEVIPVYHVGEPVDVLRSMARDYPKIALGGAVGYSKKIDWAALCFREVWPKKIHGLGYGPGACFKLPFHTVDHTALRGVFRFAQYESMGRQRLPLVGATHKHDVSVEIDHQLDSEAKARRMWRGRIPDDFGAAPSVRIVGCAATTLELETLAAYAERTQP